MNIVRRVFVFICGVSLLFFSVSGVFLFFIYDRIENQTLDYALSVAPDALSHSDAIKKKVYCPGSEAYVNFSRPEIKGYQKIINIELTPKPPYTSESYLQQLESLDPAFVLTAFYHPSHFLACEDRLKNLLKVIIYTIALFRSWKSIGMKT